MLTCPAPALLKQAIHSPSQAQPVDHIPPTSKRPVVIISSSNQYQSFHKSLHKPMNRLGASARASSWEKASRPAGQGHDQAPDPVGRKPLQGKAVKPGVLGTADTVPWQRARSRWRTSRSAS